MSDSKQPIGYANPPGWRGGPQPRTQTDWDVVRRYAEAGATCRECAQILGVTEAALYRAVQRDHEMSWAEYASQHVSAVMAEVRLKILEGIRAGDKTLLRMYALRWLDYDKTQKVEISGPDGGPIPMLVANLTDAQIIAKRDSLLASIAAAKQKQLPEGQNTNS